MIRNKINLHLHIDGSLRPSTVYEIARRENIKPECDMSLEEIEKEMIIQPGTYDPDFLCFNPPIRIMQSSYALARVTKELVEDLDKEDIKYAELRFAPQYHLEKGLTQDEVVKAVCTGLNDGLKENPSIICGVILCAMDLGEANMNHEANIETINVAKKYLGKGVVGVDLAGYESDLENFKDLFDLARSLGIPTTCHSEFTVEQAIKFNTNRIGHGYEFGLKKELADLAVKTGITLEMCPVSSVKYDYGLRIDETHPLRVLYKAGAKVTVNTDNNTVLLTSLEEEYKCMRKMGFSDNEIEDVNRNAIRAAFTDNETKRKLLALTD